MDVTAAQAGAGKRLDGAGRLALEFRDFLARGNVVDLAVGLIAGTVFGAVVNSLVSDIVMQIVAAVVGTPDFSTLSVSINGSEIRYGAFLTVLLNFVLTMAAVFLLIVKPLNVLAARRAASEVDDAPSVRPCPRCMSDVPVAATRCRYCTSELTPAVPAGDAM